MSATRVDRARRQGREGGIGRGKHRERSAGCQRVGQTRRRYRGDQRGETAIQREHVHQAVDVDVRRGRNAARPRWDE